MRMMGGTGGGLQVRAVLDRYEWMGNLEKNIWNIDMMQRIRSWFFGGKQDIKFLPEGCMEIAS